MQLAVSRAVSKEEVRVRFRLTFVLSATPREWQLMQFCGILDREVGPNGETIEQLMQGGATFEARDVREAQQAEQVVFQACDNVRTLLRATLQYSDTQGRETINLPVYDDEEEDDSHHQAPTIGVESEWQESEEDNRGQSDN